MVRKILIPFVIILIMVASVTIGSATVEWEVLNTLKLDTPPLDVAISPDGKTVFVLTHEGKARALEVIRHHQLIETLLTDVLDVPWDRVYEEAHRIEHVGLSAPVWACKAYKIRRKL